MIAASTSERVERSTAWAGTEGGRRSGAVAATDADDDSSFIEGLRADEETFADSLGERTAAWVTSSYRKKLAPTAPRKIPRNIPKPNNSHDFIPGRLHRFRRFVEQKRRRAMADKPVPKAGDVSAWRRMPRRATLPNHGLVAQPVEQRPFKALVLGSSPSQPTTFPDGLGLHPQERSRTPRYWQHFPSPSAPRRTPTRRRAYHPKIRPAFDHAPHSQLSNHPRGTPDETHPQRQKKSTPPFPSPNVFDNLPLVPEDLSRKRSGLISGSRHNQTGSPFVSTCPLTIPLEFFSRINLPDRLLMISWIASDGGSASSASDTAGRSTLGRRVCWFSSLDEPPS